MTTPTPIVLPSILPSILQSAAAADDLKVELDHATEQHRAAVARVASAKDALKTRKREVEGILYDLRLQVEDAEYVLAKEWQSLCSIEQEILDARWESLSPADRESEQSRLDEINNPEPDWMSCDSPDLRD